MNPLKIFLEEKRKKTDLTEKENELLEALAGV